MSEAMEIDGQFFVEGREFTIESQIIYALVQRLGGNVTIAHDELPTDYASQGIIIVREDDCVEVFSGNSNA